MGPCHSQHSRGLGRGLEPPMPRAGPAGGAGAGTGPLAGAGGRLAVPLLLVCWAPDGQRLLDFLPQLPAVSRIARGLFMVLMAAAISAVTWGPGCAAVPSGPGEALSQGLSPRRASVSADRAGRCPLWPRLGPIPSLWAPGQTAPRFSVRCGPAHYPETPAGLLPLRGQYRGTKTAQTCRPKCHEWSLQPRGVSSPGH